jgi:hypothetical protein
LNKIFGAAWKIPLRVKNGRDALEMGRLFYPRKQTSVGYAADCDVMFCYGGAKLADKHLASTVHCVDDEIIGCLKRREKRRRDRNLCRKAGSSEAAN